MALWNETPSDSFGQPGASYNGAYGDGDVISYRNPFSDALRSGDYMTGQNAWDWMTGKLEKQYNKAAIEYEAQMQMWNYQFDKQNAYNSPAAQAARMRAAGLNPDLQKMDNSNSSASVGGAVPQVGNTDSLDFGSVVSSIASAASMFNGIVSTVSNAIKQSWDIEAIKSGVKVTDEAARAANIQNRSRMINQVVDLASSYWNNDLYNYFIGNDSNYNPETGIYTDEQGNTFQMDKGLPRMDSAPKFSFGGYGYTDKNMVEEMDSILQGLIESNSPLLRQSVYDKRRGASASRMSYNELEGSPFSRGSDLDSQHVFGELADIQLEFQRVTQSFETKVRKLMRASSVANAANAKNDYEAELYDAMDGSVAGGFINSQNLLGSEINQGIDASAYTGAYNASNLYTKLINEYETEFNRVMDKYLVKWSKTIQSLPDSQAIPLMFLFNGVVTFRSKMMQQFKDLSQILNNIVPF